MDPSVAAMFGDSNKRKDLFNLWLTHARDFGAVRLEVSRRNVTKQSCHKKTVTWSRAQMEQSGPYTKEDIDDLIKRCTDQKRYIDDPNFPGNERLRRYHFVDEIGASNEQSQEDEQRLANTGSISSSEAIHMTGTGLGFRTTILTTSSHDVLLLTG